MTDQRVTDARSDRDLLTAHCDGDPYAFTLLVERHSDRLWALAFRTLGNRDDASDALQDALVKAFRHAASFRGDAAVTTWLHRIVVNACLDRARVKTPLPVETVPETVDATDRPEALATRLEIQEALAQLPVEQRVVVVMLDLLDRPLDEVAATLEVPSGTVKSRASRGRARLAVLLGHLSPAAGTGTGAAGVLPPASTTPTSTTPTSTTPSSTTPSSTTPTAEAGGTT